MKKWWYSSKAIGNVIPASISLCGLSVYNVDVNCIKFSDLIKIQSKKKKKYGDDYEQEEENLKCERRYCLSCIHSNYEINPRNENK